jgi:hypothetical protein
MRETNTNGAVVDGSSTKPVVYDVANVASGVPVKRRTKKRTKTRQLSR